MWISNKKFMELEKRVAELEKEKTQSIKFEVDFNEFKKVFLEHRRKTGQSILDI